MRILAATGAAIAAATGTAYLMVLFDQGGPLPWLGVGLVVAMMATMVALTAYGAWGSRPERRAMALWAAVPGFFGLGILSAFSIGGLLVLGGIPTLMAAVLSLRGLDRSRFLRGLGFLAAAALAWAAGLWLLVAIG
jgi:hypothetical protein